MTEPTRSRGRGLALLLGTQVAALVVAAFVPFGFDQPSVLSGQEGR